MLDISSPVKFQNTSRFTYIVILSNPAFSLSYYDLTISISVNDKIICGWA